MNFVIFFCFCNFSLLGRRMCVFGGSSSTVASSSSSGSGNGSTSSSSADAAGRRRAARNQWWNEMFFFSAICYCSHIHSCKYTHKHKYILVIDVRQKSATAFKCILFFFSFVACSIRMIGCGVCVHVAHKNMYTVYVCVQNFKCLYVSMKVSQCATVQHDTLVSQMFNVYDIGIAWKFGNEMVCL